MTGHTPGPWIVNGHVVVAQDDGTLIADLRRKAPTSVFEPHIGNLHLEQEEVSANACVIAAAPRLLAACEAMLEWGLSNRGTPHEFVRCRTDGNLNHPALRAARAVIAEARGLNE